MKLLKDYNITLIIDFDSTIVKTETLEDLATHVLREQNNREVVLNEISNLTKQGMEGDISFPDSLNRRLLLFKAQADDVEYIAQKTAEAISDSFIKNKAFFTTNKENIYIVSGGFKEIIMPTATILGIESDHVFANEFIYDNNRNMIGAQADNFLAQKGGKTKQVQALSLEGDVWVIGDGYTDFQIKESGAAHKFFAFTENVHRETVVKYANVELSQFDDLFPYILEKK